MFIVPEKYDVVLTFSPIEEITGHWFEVFEYYYYLKVHEFRPCMLFHAPTISKEVIMETLQDKYSVEISTDDFFVLSYEEMLIGCPLAICLVCDGNFDSLQQKGIKIVAKKILGFGCGNVTIPYGNYKNAEFLLDKRVYSVNYGTHYVKKIYADILKYPSTKENNTLFYITKNCRLFEPEMLVNLLKSDYSEYDRHVIITNDERYDELKNNSNIEIVYPPLKNMFDRFTTYVYTPIPRKFDCSPRLISECKLFGRNVDYYHIDYFDVGLETRKKDLDDGSVWMREDDIIIKLLREYM